MGHVILLTDEICGLIERHGSDLHQGELRGASWVSSIDQPGCDDRGYLAVLEGEEWNEYIQKSYKETKIRDTLVLGGVKPPLPAPSVDEGFVSFNAVFSSGNDEQVVASLIIGLLTSLSVQLARYFCQQIIGNLPDNFMFVHNDDDDDEDDEDAASDEDDNNGRQMGRRDVTTKDEAP